ncbi:MAG: glycosyltransferase family 4 protein [Patescibacteria group bacterium]
MKIAIVLWEATIFGGTQRQALELGLSLKRAGHEVGVFCYAYDPSRTYANVRNELPIYAVKEVQTALQSTVHTSSRAKKFIKKIGLYTVLLVGRQYLQSMQNLFVAEKAVVELARRMEQVHPLSYWDVINVHDYEAYKLARMIKHPNIVWMLNDMQRTKKLVGPLLHRLYMGFIQKEMIKKEIRNIRSIAVMDYRNERLCKEKYGRDSSVVRSGIDLDMFDILSSKRVPAQSPYTLFASSIFFPHRRFEDLIDALALVVESGRRNFHLVLNGSPERAYEYYTFVKNRIESKDLSEFVTLVNGLSEEELKKQYIASDIFIFPNNNQTWGLAIFEAMLAGCACIVSRGSGGHEVLTDGENALLVDPESPEQIAEKLLFLMDHPHEIERISKSGNAFVTNNLSWDKYAQQMLRVFEEIQI